MGRVEECVAIMKKVAATNGRALPSNLRELLEEAKADEKKTASMRDFLRHSSLRKHLVITSICMCVAPGGDEACFVIGRVDILSPINNVDYTPSDVKKGKSVNSP